MKIVQVADTHLRCSAQSESVRAFDLALEDIKRRHSDADLLVFSGDLVENGDIEDYRFLKSRMEGFPVPVEYLIGNHDDRETFLTVFPDRKNENGFVQRMRVLPLGRVIILDTYEPGEHHGVLCDRRLAWLEAQLVADPGPFWIFLHHNPIPTHLALMDRIMLKDHHIFGDVVAHYRNRIAHIFHGHVHLPMCGSLHGVPVSCPRSTTLTGYPNYGDDKLLPHLDLPASYGLITVEGATTTVMMVEFGADPTLRPA
ncbi:metallophosphoesterase [Rhodobacteraceae bacterium NNCM2]|nr:metallophosphoesterase [Coraliihabitans acroporae]